MSSLHHVALAASLAIFVFPATPARAVCAEDLFEGGDTCHAAPTIQDGGIQTRAFCEDAEDWAVFNACVGRIYVLSTANLEASADTVLELYGPDCVSLITSNDNGGGGRASRIVWGAPASGVYHVKIRQADGSAGLDRGYGLRLSGDTTSCETYSRTYALPPAATNVLATQTSDGGTLVVYNGVSATSRGTEPVVVRLNAAGNVVWRETLGTTLSESAIRPVQTADGGFVVAGQSGSRIWVVKLTSLGQIVWQRAQEFFSGGGLIDMQPMPDGGVIFSDGVESDALDFNSGATAKITIAGKKARLLLG